MRLYLVAFGKLKTPGMREAADYYRKIIQPWVTVEELEFKPIPVPDKSPATRAQIQQKEADILLEKLSKHLSPRGAIFVMDETGKALRTQDWVKNVREWEDQSVPEVALCIGSSLGFSDSFRKKARGVFSLGPQTLSHELARVVLLEQLYRSWSVTRGHPYHNEG